MLPLNHNINWTQLIGLLASILVLATGGKVNLDMATQAALVGIIQGVVAVVTWVQHTFINHPDNKAKAAAMVDRAVQRAKGIAPIVAVIFIAGMFLAGCASLGGYFDNPQNDLQIAEASFSTALNLYESVCSANAGAAFCTAADIQEAVDLEMAAENAIKVAESVLSVTGGGAVTSATIQTDVQSVVTAVQNFSNFVNTLEAQKSLAAAKAAAR